MASRKPRARSSPPAEPAKRKRDPGRERAIEQYDHGGQQRLSDPPVGLVLRETDEGRIESLWNAEVG
jgi:hypothetical protein